MDVTREEAARILGVHPGADAATVHRAWRQQMAAWHPDRFHGRGEAAVREAEERCKQASEARAVLLRGGGTATRGEERTSWGGKRDEEPWEEADEEEWEEDEEDDWDEDGEEEFADFADDADFAEDDPDLGWRELIQFLAEAARIVSRRARQRRDPQAVAEGLRLTAWLRLLLVTATEDRRRAARGWRLAPWAREVGEGVWYVPSQTTPGTVYRVHLEGPVCECPDFLTRRTTCKHIMAAAVAAVRQALAGEGGGSRAGRGHRR